MTYRTPRIIGLSASLSSTSNTTALISALEDMIEASFDADFQLVEIKDFLPSLGLARSVDDLHPSAKTRLDLILNADALVVGVPVYKGSYPGLFKHLIDLLDVDALKGKPILLAATGGGQKHALVIEHQLRPLFGFFEAHTLPVGIYAQNGALNDSGQFSDAQLSERAQRAVSDFAHWLPGRARLHQALGG